MIIYYSAEGNTEWVARRLSTLLVDKHVLSVSQSQKDLENALLSIEPDEPLGICFPVHAWGVPLPIQRVLQMLTKSIEMHTYLYMVCTCGDDCGKTVDHFTRLLSGKQQLSLAASVQMPNTYVNLPFFDVDSPKVVEKKMKKAEERVEMLAQRIKNREFLIDVFEGGMPSFKSGLLRKFFLRFLVKDKYFHVKEDICLHCGKCVTSCPEHNISMNNELPQWKRIDKCTTCMSCYHHCPVRAIRFGWFTRNKGQYLHVK